MTVPHLVTVLAVALLLLAPPASSQQFPDPPPLETADGHKAPPGMAFVEGGKFEMGSPARTLAKWFKGKAWLMPYVELESPEHNVTIDPFFMDRFEITNSQYHRYLEEARLDTFTVQKGALGTLAAIAAEIYTKADADWWRAIYHQNEKVVNPKKEKLNPDGTPLDSWAAEELPENLKLKIYRRPIPMMWLDWLRRGTKQPGRDEIGWPYPEDLHHHPVAGVSLVNAREFAAWAGKHIPFEDEWERAARGPKELVRTWGGTWRSDEWKPKEDRLNWGQLEANHPARSKNPAILTTPVGSFAEGMSPYGMFDMLGNVMEWTDSPLVAYPDSKLKPQDWWTAARIVRGGSYADATPELLRTTFRYGGDGVDDITRPTSVYMCVGFRCAKWLVPGADRAYQIFQSLDQAGRVPTEAGNPIKFDLRAGIGVERRLEGAANHSAYVTREVQSIGILPRLVLPRGIGIPRELEKKSSEDPEKIGMVVGLLHTGVSLAVSAPQADGSEAAATAEPGDYLVCYHDGRLQLARPKLRGAERVGYVTTKAQREEFDIEAAADEKIPPLVKVRSFDGPTSIIMQGYDRVDIVFSVAKAVTKRDRFIFRATLHTAEKDAVTIKDWKDKQK